MVWFWKKAATVALAVIVLASLSSIVSNSTSYAAASTAPVVSPDGWGWQNPLPQGNTLNDVWCSSPSDVFAVGDGGTILHYNGSDWNRMSSGTTYALNGVWGTSSSDVFAVGYHGTILHYDGNTWGAMSSGTLIPLNDVWGSSSSDVFAVGVHTTAAGEGDTILHFDGNVWSNATSGIRQALYGVWGSSDADVFAVGAQVFHYDGSAWSTVATGTGYDTWFYDVWGTVATDVFGVGSSGKIMHFDGTAWGAMASNTRSSLVGVWGSSSSDVFAVGADGAVVHYDGGTWTPMSAGGSGFCDIWGTSSSDVFAVGYFGTMAHYDGSVWGAMSSGIAQSLYGVWGNSSSDVFAVGASGTILHYDGSAWSAMTSGTTNLLCGVWGSSSSDVFAVGDGGTILHYNGSAWSAMSSGTTNLLRGVWGSSSTDIFAVGGYAATDGNLILHYDGSTWSTMYSDMSEVLESVWGSAPNDVFAVGWASDGYCTILHYDGSTWSPMSYYMKVPLSGVWGIASDDVYAVGGGVFHYDGSSWSEMSDSTTAWLRGVWGNSATDVFAVGSENSVYGGVIQHHDGSVWSAMDSGSANILWSVWGTSASDVFAVGDGGTILHYGDALAPTAVADLGASSATLNSVFLTWTAPGDDDDTGTASAYDVRYSTAVITDANWGAATQCSGEPAPQVAGSSETFTVTGLAPDTTYYFAIKTADEAPNWSALSNVSSWRTEPLPDTTPPAAVADLAATAATIDSVTLTWTSPGDDGSTGSASKYDIRYSTGAITDANWGAATQCNGEPAPKMAGSLETFTVTGLSPDTTYYFAIKTADEVPNWSALSNVVGKETEVADTTAPTISLTSTVVSPTSTSPVPVTATFSEPVTGFSTDDIVVGNGTVSDFVAVSATVYTFNVTPSGQGAVTVNIAAGVAQDAAGNGNAGAAQFGVDYVVENATATPDETAPTVPQVIDDGESTGDTTSLHATWSSSDPESGILEYQYAVGSFAGGADVVGWTSAGTATEATVSGLSLTPGQTYYVSAKALNGQGLWSDVGRSNGINVLADDAEPASEKEDKAGMPFWGWIIVGVGGVAVIATGLILWRPMTKKPAPSASH